MSKLLSITITLLFIGLHSMAASDYHAQWKKGTVLYEEKQYDSAAHCFEQIAALKPDNAEVYYNLGNTYYRLNNIGPAVLNYERALRINPEYTEAKDNLLLAQSRISNHILYTGDIFFINWWRSATRPDRATAWAVAALITFALTILLLIIRHFQKTGKRLPVQLPGVLGFVCVCLLMFAFAAAGKATEHATAVVMQNDVPLMNADQKGKPLALIPEGTSVTIKEERAGWTEVSLPDGRSGWLQQSLISKI
ncbi:MAG: Tetratricopeptide 1 repeat-containing protein [Flavipsychrobacter sp.]|nr:Tetratricopeptide 1 repeat-containing protein [Flavipsychrobacter sp.]